MNLPVFSDPVAVGNFAIVADMAIYLSLAEYSLNSPLILLISHSGRR
jgi:hypothetical protein